MTDVDAINFFRDPEVIGDPHPYFDAMRAQCPVRREPHHNVVMITGYEEALGVYNDHETWSSCISVTGPFPGFPVPTEGIDDLTELIIEHRDKLPMSDQLPTLDPPDHTDARALMMRLLTPKRLKENEDLMESLADEVLDPVLALGGCEFIRHLAQPYTREVISDLLGVPLDDREGFAQAFGHIKPGEGGIGGMGEAPLGHSPLEYLYGRFSEYIAERRVAPLDDVLTGFAEATYPDGRVPEPIEVARVASNVFAAGQETTVRLLGTALQLIGDDPALQASLRAEPARLGNFIEECLRWDGPIKGDFRMNRVATTVGDQQFPPGTIVMLVNAAANRDPRRFDNPGAFDPDRANARQHVAFGRGIHACPGSPLARAEARVLLERLLARTTDIRVSTERHGPAGARNYTYVPTFILRGVTSLHLEVDIADSTDTADTTGSGAA